MKLWHAPARALPVTVRPIGGETTVSYAWRLSAANDLPPTTVLRALGQLTGKGSGKHLLTCDARLNDQAADRLEAYTGIPVHRIHRQARIRHEKSWWMAAGTAGVRQRGRARRAGRQGITPWLGGPSPLLD